MAPSRRSGARWTYPVVVAVVVAVTLAVLPAPALAGPEDDLEAAQERANGAARELAAAEEELALAQDAVTRVQTRVSTVDARVGAARDRVRDLAIRLYVEGTVPVIRILRMADANDVIRAQQYSHVVAGGSTDSLRQFRADREDLRREQSDLEEEQESHARSLEDLRQRRVEAVAELDRLSEVVARVEAERAAQRRAEAASALAAAPSSGSTSGTGTGTGTGTAPAGGSSSEGGPDPTTLPASTSPDGAEVSDPADETAATGGWICPVQGPLAFSNDYGAPRGGGFSHEGNDILSPRGTPVVASVDGEVRHRSGAVSGLAYYLDGDDGTEYFGAHLDSFGADGRVSAGTVVGYVGNTGDAASTAPHLHFEIHPGGNGNINPYATLTQYC